MKRVDNTHRTQWGSVFQDRTNSYDDKQDIQRLSWLSNEDPSFKKYLQDRLPDLAHVIRPHPDGQYGVDVGLISNSGTRLGNMDLERWRNWGSDWPSFYKGIHFLARKDKYLESDLPFFMAYWNNDRTRLLMVDKETILQYPVQQKTIKQNNTVDSLRIIPLRCGYIFGEVTETEGKLFKRG